MRHPTFALSAVLALATAHCSSGAVNRADLATASTPPGASSSAAAPARSVPSASVSAEPLPVPAISSSTAPARAKKEELVLKWTALATGSNLYWLAGELVEVTTTLTAVAGAPRSRLEIGIDWPSAGKGKSPVRHRTTVNGVDASADVDVTPTGTDWTDLEFSVFLQASSISHVKASTTFSSSGRKWTPSKYEPAGPMAVKEPGEPLEGPWCSVEFHARTQAVSPGLTFHAGPCVFAFEPPQTTPAILPPGNLSSDKVSAVAESARVVWLATPGTPARIHRWESGTWTSAPLPREVGRYSLMLDHRPGLGLVAISDHTSYAKIERVDADMKP
jgi:hypothetical protein